MRLNQFFVSQGGSSESCFTYLGRVDADEAFDWVRTGKVVNLVLANVLQWLEINREDVRIKWA